MTSLHIKGAEGSNSKYNSQIRLQKSNMFVNLQEHQTILTFAIVSKDSDRSLTVGICETFNYVYV